MTSNIHISDAVLPQEDWKQGSVPGRGGRLKNGIRGFRLSTTPSNAKRLDDMGGWDELVAAAFLNSLSLSWCFRWSTEIRKGNWVRSLCCWDLLHSLIYRCKKSEGPMHGPQILQDVKWAICTFWKLVTIKGKVLYSTLYTSLMQMDNWSQDAFASWSQWKRSRLQYRLHLRRPAIGFSLIVALHGL